MESSLLGKIIVIISIVGTVLFIVGFSTDYWQEASFSHAGLWRSCTLGLCSESKPFHKMFEDDNICKFYTCLIYLSTYLFWLT